MSSVARLGRDPELRYSQSGAPVCTLNVATDESWTRTVATEHALDRAEWHRVVVFQKAAENCSQYLTEGEPCLCGRQPPDPQVAGPAGRGTRYTTEIKAQRVQFLDKRGGDQNMPAGEGGYAPRRPAAAPAAGRRPPPRSARSSGRTITKTWALPFPPKPAAWTTCRSNRHPKGRDARLFLFLKRRHSFLFHKHEA